MNKQVVVAFVVVAALMVAVGNAPSETDGSLKGLDIKKTGLIPRYPIDRVCPTLTSFYASWDDVRRNTAA